MWNLKHGTNAPFFKTETDAETETNLVFSSGEGAGGGKGREFGVSRYKLLCTDTEQGPAL